MTKRNWKRVQAHSLRDALELCKEHARERHNLSVERIAERIGLADHWTLYKWISSARIPVSHLRAFEVACGIDLVTRYLAASSGRLVVDMPTGKKAAATDMQALQESLHTAVGALLQFYSGGAKEDETLGAIRGALEGLAWHRENVARNAQPELELEM